VLRTEIDWITMRGVVLGDNLPWVIYKILQIYVPNEQLSSTEDEPHYMELASYGKFTHQRQLRATSCQSIQLAVHKDAQLTVR
jgi:hypothetical protein